MKGVLIQKKLRGDAAGSYGSRALEEAIEVEHLKVVLLESSLRGRELRGRTQRRRRRVRRRRRRSRIGLLRNLEPHSYEAGNR